MPSCAVCSGGGALLAPALTQTCPFAHQVNAAIRSHPVEVIGLELRGYMSDMEAIAVGQEGATTTTGVQRIADSNSN